MDFFSGKWPFYMSGPIFALVLLAGLYLFDDVVGIGDAMVVISDFCKNTVSADKAPEAPKLDWQCAFLGGIFVGSLIAALASKQFKVLLIFETSGLLTSKFSWTVVGGLGGGFLVMLGSQLAGETPWGQLAAALQMSGAAWVYLLSFTAAGVVFSLLLDRKNSGGGAGGGGGKDSAKGAK